MLLLLAAGMGLAGSEAVRAESSTGAAEELDWNKAREFWSFRAPQAQPVPRVQNTQWPRQRMDSFILADNMSAQGFL